MQMKSLIFFCILACARCHPRRKCAGLHEIQNRLMNAIETKESIIKQCSEKESLQLDFPQKRTKNCISFNLKAYNKSMTTIKEKCPELTSTFQPINIHLTKLSKYWNQTETEHVCDENKTTNSIMLCLQKLQDYLNEVFSITRECSRS